MSSVVIDTSTNRFSYTNNDNVMAKTANVSDKANLSRLKNENQQLQEEVNKLTSENQALSTQIAKFKSAVNVDISSKIVPEQNRELSRQTKEVLEKNNINLANDSANFTKQHIANQTGSMIIAQANTSSESVQRYTAE